MLNSIIQSNITLSTFAICTLASLVIGLGISFLCMYKNSCSQSFILTLAILPVMVQVIIMLVNGNIGTGVAVAGAFSLVRFRSLPGTAKDIGLIFLAMAIGLATGMGYVALAALFFVIVAVFILLLSSLNLGVKDEHERELKITIPENLEYDGLFDDLFQKYTKSVRLDRVKTSNMGTLYELHYHIVLPGDTVPKSFMDDLRCRNGNLTIQCSRIASKDAVL